MQLQESGEMYLEVIYILSQSGEPVRSLDIANHMNYSKPSVSRAVKILKEGKFIVIDGNGHITLTDNGYDVATTIYERHTVLSKILIDLGVDKYIASDDACKIEHVISQASFDALRKHFDL